MDAPVGRLEREGASGNARPARKGRDEVRERESVQSIWRLPILRFTSLLDFVKPSNLANIWSAWKERGAQGVGGGGGRVGGTLNSPWARDPLNEITGRALPAN